MTDHQLDALVRPIDPENFSEAAHGAGHRIVHAGRDRVQRHEPKLLDLFRSRRHEVHYFVRKLSTPLVVDAWEHRWSEGTSAVTLDFISTFEILANEEHHARQLVEVLHAPEGPAATLHALIQRHLHEAISQQAGECKAQGRNLLALFRTSSVGIGEYEPLNTAVSAKVRDALGGLPFRIGFRLRNLPPMQLEVKQEDSFTLGDSKRERKVVTTALLQLDDYQTYRKAGLDTEEAIRTAIRQSIAQAVKRHLFAQRYYAVVRSFSSGRDSIESRMRAHIEDDAARIGYRVNMFQIFPDIAALALLHGVRIDLPADEFSYRPENSAGFVQMNVALSVKARDFELLDRLIGPDDEDIRIAVRRQVHQICQDQIRHVSRMVFNLRFNDDVVPKVAAAIVSGLRAYGLDCDIIHVTQSPTEEAARFGAICGQTRDFSALVPAHAETGDADYVTVNGRVEVTGMAENGWESFVRKDFGYRADSHWTESKLRQRALLLEIDFDDTQPMTEVLRRHLAIELELVEIRRGVESALVEGLATHAGLAAETRTPQGRMKLSANVQELAKAAILREFGLVVDIHGIRRADTDAEISFQARRGAGHDLIRQRAKQEAALDHDKFDTMAEGIVSGIKEDFEMRKLLQAERSDDPVRDLAAIETRLARETAGSGIRNSLNHAGAMRLLQKAPAPARSGDSPGTTQAPAPGDTRESGPDASG